MIVSEYGVREGREVWRQEVRGAGWVRVSIVVVERGG